MSENELKILLSELLSFTNISETQKKKSTE